MKTIHQNIALLFAFAYIAVVTGCGTLSDPSLDQSQKRLANAAQLAAYIGTHEAIRSNPDYRSAFALANNSLEVLVNDETPTFEKLRQIMVNLPIKELKSERATLYIGAATILLEDYEQDIKDLDLVTYIRPIVIAIHDGMDQALRETATASP